MDMDDHRSDDLLGGLDGDPVGDVLGDLRDGLVQLPAREVREMHLAAMTGGAVTAGSPAGRRRVIRHALVAAGLKVALVSTAAAATTGALGVGGVLPDPVQRVVADAGARWGLELPSPPAVVPSADDPTEPELDEPTVADTPDDPEPAVGTPSDDEVPAAPPTETPDDETPDPRRQVAKEEDGEVEPDDGDDDDGDDPSEDEPSVDESVDEAPEPEDEPSEAPPAEDDSVDEDDEDSADE